MSSASRVTRHHIGASLVEILVVIVIFLVGILSVVQVFPKGLAVLRTTSGNTMAIHLARSEMERLKGMAEQLPEAILSVNYSLPGTLDLNRWANDPLGDATSVDGNGVVYIGSTPVDDWKMVTGPNATRRVVGEGKIVPAPRFVHTPVGVELGALLMLEFAPVAVGNAYTLDPKAYGNDLRRVYFAETIDPSDPDLYRRYRDYTIWMTSDSSSDYQIALPRGSAIDRHYRLSFSYWRSDGSSNAVVINDIVVPNSGGASPYMEPIDLRTYIPSETDFHHLDLDTVRCQRQFEKIDASMPFTTSTSVPVDDRAYQFKVIEPRLGMLLFNPAGSNYKERRGRSYRAPMVARVDYDVLDWRNIRDDFRVPSDAPYQQKLLLRSLMHVGRPGADSKPFVNLGFSLVPPAPFESRDDFILIDIETGGIFDKASYEVDYSQGIVRFIDKDPSTDGVQGHLFFPGGGSQAVTDSRRRSVRAIYQAIGDWAVQPVKPVSSYVATTSPTLGYGQCYIGGTYSGVGKTSRIYFPISDTGKKVTIAELYCRNAQGQMVEILDQEFIIRPPRVDDNNKYAFIDILEIAEVGSQLDHPLIFPGMPDSHGYAVRGVRGTTVGVRVTWNPNSFKLVQGAENLSRVSAWYQELRKNDTETFLMKGGIE